MSKVILTQKQADAIEKLKDSIRENHQKFKSNHQCNLADWEYVLLDIPTGKYMNAIFEGYEVKPTFKVAEYIVYENEVIKNVMQIINIDSDDIIVEPIYEGFEDYNRVSVNSPLIRRATPEEITEEEERRWWARHGRDPWELKDGDLLINEKEDIFKVTNSNPPEGYYSIEYTLFDHDEIKRGFRVLCFAENRLDVRNDE